MELQPVGTTANNATRDSVLFEINKTEIETVAYPNPTQNILHIKYKSGISNNAFMSISALAGKQAERKTIGNIKEEDLDLASYK